MLRLIGDATWSRALAFSAFIAAEFVVISLVVNAWRRRHPAAKRRSLRDDWAVERVSAEGWLALTLVSVGGTVLYLVNGGFLTWILVAPVGSAVAVFCAVRTRQAWALRRDQRDPG